MTFNFVFYFSTLAWLFSFLFLFLKKNRLSYISGLCGILILAFYITYLWISLDRPPLRTLGETRLWYALLLPTISVILDWYHKLKWLNIYAFSMSILFLFLNYLHPENFDKTLAPALQSPWFIPHVIVYMLSYAVLAATCLFALHGLYKVYRHKNPNLAPLLSIADNLVNIGFALLSMGLIFGALWAKEAWGHYWTWDPKETWAALTWLAYLIFIHLRFKYKDRELMAIYFLAMSFIILLGCWFGVNYLPTATQSVHTYTNG